MADRVESEDETKQLRSTVLQTATPVLQIRQQAEQEKGQDRDDQYHRHGLQELEGDDA